MIPPVALRKVGKTYDRHRALMDVSAELAPGQVTAIVGPNGAGKSTLLGLLSTLVPPSAGSITWGAEPLGRRSRLRADIGYVGHEPGVYGDLTARQNLALFAALYGVADGVAQAEGLLSRVGLADGAREAACRTFSRGMLQRLALARALLHRPRLLLFDEPGAALDPAGVDWLAGQLRTEREAGRIVVFVTHDLDAAGAVADHLLILRRGRLVFDEARPGGFSGAAVRALYQERVRG